MTAITHDSQPTLQSTDAAPGEQAPYCPSPYRYERRRTHVVMVGDVGVGGDNPIRVQSMTTTRTLDTDATVAQAERLVAVGCEIVRITAPTVKDARNIGLIKRQLRDRGIGAPIVADIHFSPEAALEAAEHVEKVRINPGNYADSRKFAVREYTDAEYAAELARIEQRFAPLVRKCKQRGIAMRIGTNHGSLSDRIVNRFGDTPEGMVESALEFVRICEKLGYYDVILSMKASNPKVMIAAYRLLAARMATLGMTYPFHLGVTEAGNGEDARIKSAIGIGSLLADGIGDTIRVSLAEEPEEEIPVAYALANRYTSRGDEAMRRGGEEQRWWTSGAGAVTAGADTAKSSIVPSVTDAPHLLIAPSPHRPGLPSPRLPWDPCHFERRHSGAVQIGPVTIGGGNTIAVVARPGEGGAAQLLRWASPGARRLARPDVVEWPVATDADVTALRQLRARLDAATGLALLPAGPNDAPPKLALLASSSNIELLQAAMPLADGVLVSLSPGPAQQPRVGTRYVAEGPAEGVEQNSRDASTLGRLAATALEEQKALWLEATVRGPMDRDELDGAGHPLDRAVDDLLAAYEVCRRAGLKQVVLGVSGETAEAAIHALRLLAARLSAAGYEAPLLLRSAPVEEPLIPASIGLGSLLCDGVGDVVHAATPAGGQEDVQLTFNVLQAAGSRLSKTDYVACPSCGRTLFDLQSTTERIKAKTSHLVGVKIAIMGCVVNGPGEMADADFGYVGGSPGHVNLYVGKTCVERSVPAEIADERLVALMKSHGRWQEPEADDGHEEAQGNSPEP